MTPSDLPTYMRDEGSSLREAKEVRHATDPVSGERVEIRNDLVRRLRGEYACGPTLPNGEPEFGWRKFGTQISIQIEAADEIERLKALLSPAQRDYLPLPDRERTDTDIVDKREEDGLLKLLFDALIDARDHIHTFEGTCDATDKIDVALIAALEPRAADVTSPTPPDSSLVTDAELEATVRALRAGKSKP